MGVLCPLFVVYFAKDYQFSYILHRESFKDAYRYNSNHLIKYLFFIRSGIYNSQQSGILPTPVNSQHGGGRSLLWQVQGFANFCTPQRRGKKSELAAKTGVDFCFFFSIGNSLRYPIRVFEDNLSTKISLITRADAFQATTKICGTGKNSAYHEIFNLFNFNF